MLDGVWQQPLLGTGPNIQKGAMPTLILSVAWYSICANLILHCQSVVYVVSWLLTCTVYVCAWNGFKISIRGPKKNLLYWNSFSILIDSELYSDMLIASSTLYLSLSIGIVSVMFVVSACCAAAGKIAEKQNKKQSNHFIAG